MLPERVHLDEVKATLDTVNIDNVQANPDTNTKLTTSQQQPSTSSVLKLRGSAGTSYSLVVCRGTKRLRGARGKTFPGAL